MLMSKAGYDPHAGVDVWTRMTVEEEKKKQGGGGAMPEFLSSHPTSERRVERMKEWGEGEGGRLCEGGGEGEKGGEEGATGGEGVGVSADEEFSGD